MNDKEFLSIGEAAVLTGTTANSLYIAIRENRLKAKKLPQKYPHIWKIKPEAVEAFLNNKYSRKNTLFKGKLVHDKSKGEHSIKDAANLLGLSWSRVYYLLRTGEIKYSNKGRHVVIHIDDIKAYQNILSKLGVRI